MSGGRRRLANLLGRSGKNGGEEGSGSSPGPLLSIVLPIYNVEEYLEECLDSIAAQSFSDYELLVVDDGSPDGSRAIAERYAGSDRRIRIITRENGGLGAARNTGFREAAGCDCTLQGAGNACHSGFGCRGRALGDGHVQPGTRGNLGDPRPHQAAPDHTDTLDHPRHDAPIRFLDMRRYWQTEPS